MRLEILDEYMMCKHCGYLIGYFQYEHLICDDFDCPRCGEFTVNNFEYRQLWGFKEDYEE